MSCIPLLTDSQEAAITALCSSCLTPFTAGPETGPRCGFCRSRDRLPPDPATPCSASCSGTPGAPQDPSPATRIPESAAQQPVLSRRRWHRYAAAVLVTVVMAFATLNVWMPPQTRFMHDNVYPYVYQYVSIDHISRYVLAAAVLHEDGQLGLRIQPFHWGDFLERIRDHRAGHNQKTFSTIPQQLAKNMFFTAEQSGLRKAVEILPATLLNYTLPDRRILEMYINYAEYGRNLFGICAATWYYFDEPPWNVNLDQAATLSGMLPNPQDVDRLRGGGVSHPDTSVYPSAAYHINGALNVDIPQRLAAWGGWKPVMESVGIDDTASDHVGDRPSSTSCSSMPEGVRDRLAAEDPDFVSQWAQGRTIAQVAAAGSQLTADDRTETAY